MAHFAEIDNSNIVMRVIVIDNPHEGGGEEFIPYDLNLGGRWLQTSYNGTIRKNYAGIGFSYDPTRDAFIPPKPFPSWILNETTCQWEAPTPIPTVGSRWNWDESSLTWMQG